MLSEMECFSPELLKLLYGWGMLLQKIEKELLEDVENKLYVFDWDGTLTEFKYGGKRLLPCPDHQVADYSAKGNNIYKDARVLECMKYLISKLPENQVYILTRTETTLIEMKEECIFKHYPFLQNLEGHVIHVQDSNNKLNVIEKLHNATGKEVVFVEDTFKTILNAEEMIPNCMGEDYHISSFLF